jgi:ABC-type amino acid transport substrate-binding protein
VSRALAAVALVLLCLAPCFAQTLTLSAQADVSALRPISQRIVEEAFERAGMKVIFKPLPLERAIEEANDGVTDGDMHRIADVAALYPNLLTVPTPINKVYLVIYGRGADMLTKTRADIMKMKIAYPRGVLLQRKYSKGMNTTEARVYATTFDMLFNGRVDAVMMSHVDTEAQITERRYPERPVMWPHVWASEPLYLVLHRRHEALIPRLDTALQQMQREGLIERYYDDALSQLNIARLPADQPAPAAPERPAR